MKIPVTVYEKISRDYVDLFYADGEHQDFVNDSHQWYRITWWKGGERVRRIQ